MSGCNKIECRIIKSALQKAQGENKRYKTACEIVLHALESTGDSGWFAEKALLTIALQVPAEEKNHDKSNGGQRK